MHKKLLGMLLALTMLVSQVTPALAADADEPTDVLERQDAAGLVSGGESITVPGEGEDVDVLTQQDAAGFLLLWAGMDEEQLGNYPYDWNAMALSAAVVDEDTFAPEEPCTYAAFNEMAENVMPLYDALHADKMEPLFINGMAQPIFPYTTGAVEEGYSNEDSDIIRYCVYVETNYDTDGDGKLDLVKALVQLPRAAAEGDYQAATIYEARPYITGCTDYSIPYGEGEFDINDLYAQPEARVAEGTATTMEAAADAVSSDWYYFNPFEDMMDYEDLDWYDYYLVRGFAVVECGGLGTRGSEGFETCGSDLEIDAFKCVIEWLHGDRVAYTDKESNIEIKADWSNGKVGMTGRSYAGTTQFGLATTGVEGLETIVPVAGIASWYEYTNSQGISTRSNVAYTNSLAAYCAGRYLDSPEAEAAASEDGINDYARTDDYESIRENYSNYLGALMRQQQALNGDYASQDESVDNNTWEIRDYTLNADKIQCPALLVHGLNDYNVRTKEFELMYNAFEEAGQNVKILLHQDGHLTPTYPAGGLVFDIGDQTYDEILNKWFSHYLYGVENNAENMPAVTAQDSHDTDVWNSYASWKAEDSMTFQPSEELEETTTISSNYADAGITRQNWQSEFTSGSTSGSVMYTQTVESDFTIKGSVAVNFSASTANESTDAVPYADTEANETPRGTVVDHDSMMDQLQEPAVMAVNMNVLDESETPLSERDALMVSAMLVDIAPEGETFPAFNTSGSYVPKTTIMEGGAWMGGGLKNFDLTKLNTSDVSYKIISRGWMDLCNPDAGFDSNTASTRVSLEEGKSYDYTIYLQPTVYTIEEGHTLALVIYAYEPGMAQYTQNYEITVNNASVNADIPVSADPVAFYTVNYSAENGSVESAVVNGDKVTEGSEVTLTAVPASGYYFVNWTVNGKDQAGSATETLVINEDTTIVANFARESSSSSGGSPSKAEDDKDEESTALPFADAANHWAADAIAYVYDNGLMGGTSATTFAPDETLTRAMTVTILWRAAGEPAAEGTNPFADVAADTWYTEAVQWAYANGIVGGVSETSFAPNSNITREQMAAMLYRYAQYEKYTVEAAEDALADYADVSDVSSYAVEAMQWACGEGLINGRSDSELIPGGTATRAEAATILMRFVENVAK